MWPAVDNRSQAGKKQMLEKFGGSAASESAVQRALEWIVSVQHPRAGGILLRWVKPDVQGRITIQLVQLLMHSCHSLRPGRPRWRESTKSR